MITCSYTNKTNSSHGGADRRGATYQVNIRHKVAVQGCWDSKSPDTISQRFPDVEVEDLVDGGAAAACVAAGSLSRQQRLVEETSQHQHKHEDAEDAHGVVKAHSAQQARQHEGQDDGEDAAAGGHDAVHQAQALLEVVAQDDQAGLVGEGAAAGKHNAVGEVQGPQGAARRSNHST